jgi:hypothetical protein
MSSAVLHQNYLTSQNHYTIAPVPLTQTQHNIMPINRAQVISFSAKPMNKQESLINDNKYLTSYLPLVQRLLVAGALAMKGLPACPTII